VLAICSKAMAQKAMAAIIISSRIETLINICAGVFETHHGLIQGLFGLVLSQ
jgi:hypothetical protein